MAKPKSNSDAVADLTKEPPAPSPQALDPKTAAKEKASFEAWRLRSEAMLILPRVTIDEDGRFGTDFPEPGKGHLLMMSALGLSRSLEMTTVLNELAAVTVGENGNVDLNRLNGALAMVAAMKPTNTTEALLATQMVAVHIATMSAGARLSRAATAERIDANAGTMNRLARTFTMQIEALKKLRPGGAQHVLVEHRHYHLHQGAEPVPGEPGAGVTTEIEDQSHVRSIPQRAAVFGAIEADGAAMPGTGDDRQGSVSVPRRQSRGALRAV